jgi:hypothetical protein
VASKDSGTTPGKQKSSQPNAPSGSIVYISKSTNLPPSHIEKTQKRSHLYPYLLKTQWNGRWRDKI